MASHLQPNGFGGAGLDDSVPDIVRNMRLANAVTRGDVVAWVAVTDPTAEATVEQLDVSDAAPNLIAGVAMETGIAGELIQVCRAGPCLVNVGDATVTAGQVAGLHATTDGAADNADATEGGFGVFLTANDVGGTNFAWVDVWLGKRAPDA